MLWILFHYNVPNKPSKLRVYVWRKLKAIRAEQLTEGLYALPLTAKTQEQLEWLCAEVAEMHGTAVLWKSECLSQKQETELIARFQDQADKSYDEIQSLLSHKPETEQGAWLDSIIRMYADTRYHDYFNAYSKHRIHTQLERYFLKDRGGGRGK